MRGDGSGAPRVPATLPDVQSANVQELIGYIKPGPYRPPFSLGPQGSNERAEKAASNWLALSEKYRPEVEAWRAAHN